MHEVIKKYALSGHGVYTVIFCFINELPSCLLLASRGEGGASESIQGEHHFAVGLR